MLLTMRLALQMLLTMRLALQMLLTMRLALQMLLTMRLALQMLLTMRLALQMLLTIRLALQMLLVSITDVTDHEVSITDVVFDESSSQYYHPCVLGVNCLTVHPSNIYNNKPSWNFTSDTCPNVKIKIESRRIKVSRVGSEGVNLFRNRPSNGVVS